MIRRLFQAGRLLVLWMAGLTLLLPVQAMAQQVRALVDPQVTSPGSPVMLSIEVRNGSASPPRLPSMPSWRAQYLGQQTSIESINLSFSQKLTFNYQLFPLREGTLSIPPITVDVGGETFQTQPLKVQVRSVRASRGSPDLPAGVSEPVVVEVELTPEVVFVGQAMVQTLRVLSSEPLGQNIQVGRRPIPGTIEESLDERAQRTISRVIDEVQYRGEEARWIFYPITSGPLAIPALEVTVPVLERSARRRRLSPFDDLLGGFTQVVPRLFRSEEQSVEVRPLPAEGKPVGFSGLVGAFRLEASVSSTAIALGDSVTQTVVLEGRGNLRDLQLPALSSADLKVYDDTPVLEVEPEFGPDSGGTLRCRRTFKRALVPQRSGQVEIPELVLYAFDPEAERYTTLSWPATTLQVAPGAGGTTSLVATDGAQSRPLEQRIRATGAEDILPLYAGPGLGRDRRIQPLAPSSLAWLLSPALAYLGLALGLRARARRDADPAQRRRRQAGDTALRSLRALEKAGAASAGPSDAVNVIARTFQTYLGDRLSCEGGALTSGDVRERLARARIAGERADEAARLLGDLEAARYAPGGSQHQVAALLERVRKCIEALEKEARG